MYGRQYKCLYTSSYTQPITMEDTETMRLNDFVQQEGEYILNRYIDEFDEFPDDIYSDYLDDDYQDAEELFLLTLTIDDVPTEFIEELMNREPEE